MFVCFKGRIEPLPDESGFAEFLGVLLRHEAIKMVCAYVPQSRELPPHCGGVLGASDYTNMCICSVGIE